MQRTNWRAAKRTALLVALAGGAIGASEASIVRAAPATAAKQRPKIEPRADERLRAMSRYLGGLKSFGFHAQNSTQVVTKGGQKLDLTAESVVLVRRPDRLQAAREGELASLVLYYDGATITVFDNRSKQYATAPVPGTIDTMLPYVNQRLDVEIPGADMVSEDAYSLVTADAIEGTFVAEATLDGARCDHLAFRGKNVDTQLWVQQGDTPIPRRYVITSKKVSGAPQYEVVIRDFNPSVRAPDEAFAFRPPDGAKKIEPKGPTKPKK